MALRKALRKKADIWISMILYTLIVVVAILLILGAGIPLMEGLKDKNLFVKSKNTMASVNRDVRNIAEEGQGSQRVVSIEVPEGYVKIEDNKMSWVIESKTKVVDSSSSIQEGYLRVRSGSKVSVIETDDPAFLVENSKLIANLSKVGNDTDWQSISTVTLINSLLSKEKNAYVSGNFTFKINDDSNSASGNGYSKMLQTGQELSYAAYLAHINSSSYEYDLLLTLDADADFLKVEAENIRPK